MSRDFLVTTATVALMMTACGVSRPALSPAELEAEREYFREKAQEDRREGTRKLTARIRYEHAEYVAGLTTERPVLDVLILSGGGDYGAFGAGVLRGWQEVKDNAFTLPEFDVVTGISTGALISPFAYVGTDAARQEVLDLYSEPQDDWITFNGIASLFGGASFLSTAGLERDLKAACNEAMLRAIAEESRKERVLSIGATNLDVGMQRAWDLGEIAETFEATGESQRFYDVLMASAAVPAAFPPRLIDNGLYVDGGATSNILYGTTLTSSDSAFLSWQRENADVEFPRIRVWVIVNNQLESTPRVVQPTWSSITVSSMSTAIRASTITSLRYLASSAHILRELRGIEIEFRYIPIPEEWRPPESGTFNAVTMQDLAELGYALGRDPTSWRTYLPQP